jgi:hypothetical protein
MYGLQQFEMLPMKVALIAKMLAAPPITSPASTKRNTKKVHFASE